MQMAGFMAAVQTKQGVASITFWVQGAMDKGWLHQKGGQPNMQDILRCAIEIGGALRYLHSRSILHGDLTGSNVLLSSCGRDSRGWICKVSHLEKGEMK